MRNLIMAALLVLFSINGVASAAAAAEDDDIFPTFHRVNTKSALIKLSYILQLKQLIYIQDINWTRRWLFLLYYIFHLKTKFFHIPFLRSNFIAILQKN